MRRLNRLFTRLFNFTIRHSAEERFKEEIESHLAMQAEENIRAGMSSAEARRQARLKFGPVEAIRESYYAEKGLPFAESVLLDVRHALRGLRKTPAFALVAFLTLMLGITANVVVLGVAHAVLRPPEVRDPSSLYQLRRQPWMSGRLITTSYPAFEDFRRRNTTFAGMAAVNGYAHALLGWRNTLIEVSGDEVTDNYFDLLGVQPEAGRLFHEAPDPGPVSAPCVVLSDQLWRSAFRADPGLIGATVQLNRRSFTVIGVASPQFHGVERFAWPDYWRPFVNDEPLTTAPVDMHDRRGAAVTVIARLKPGVTPQQATENLNAISAELAREYPRTDDGQPLRLVHPGLFGDDGEVIRGFLYGVAVLALLVLAAVCANLATLFMARAADRGPELALRVALGSSRWRLIRQLLIEASVLSLVSGAAALVSAHLLLGILNRWPPLEELHLAAGVDGRMCLAGLALTLASALLVGMVPARRAWQSSPLQMMKRAALDSRTRRRFALPDLFLLAQIAICTLLVTASCVAGRGMLRTLHVPLGFQPQGAMLVDLDFAQEGRPTDATPWQMKAIIDAARGIPGVTAAGSVSRTPMTGGMRGVPIFRPGTADFSLGNSVLAPYVFSMSPGYLKAAGTRLLAGRDVSWQDAPQTPHVAVVNENFARKMWGETSAIGQHFIVSGILTEVVGVAEDGKYHDLEEEPQPVAYLALSQSDDTASILIVRSLRASSEMAPALEHTLGAVGPNVSVSARSWPDALADLLLPAKAAATALGVMGVLAAMLAITGIFGLASYNVSRRMKELGIRVALGAPKIQVMKVAVGRAMVLLGVGSALGLLFGLVASRLLRQIVYQANPRDPLVIGAAVLTMALLGVIAAAAPAHRALTLDPTRVMRED